jgi:hypothetical protein
MVTVSIPLIVVVLMERMVEFLPSHLELDNPFGTDWETLERVAMACLIVQFQTEKATFHLHEVRPGAALYAQASVVKINHHHPTSTFDYLGTFIEGNTLISGKKADGSVVVPAIGHVMITAKNQFAIDGFAILEGLVDGKVMPIVWFSQMKAVDGVNKYNGKKSATTLYDGTIKSDILPKMRAGANLFRKKHPQFQHAFIVYDVFSDREPPKKDNAKFLRKNEALFVTRSDTLDTVLGGFVARKREIVDRYIRTEQ